MTKVFDPATALAGLPNGLRAPLLAAFNEIMRNFRENRWEPSELNGGKLCEIAYTIIRGYADGKMPARPSKPTNMVDACKAMEAFDQTRFPRSIRIQIPRMTVALYEVRNNRGVGHVGGDVNPNHMDARAVVEMAKWIMAELIRVFHGLDTTEATAVVEALVERTVPIVWEVQGRRRVLDPKLSKGDQTLLVLYASSGPILDRDLAGWVEHSNLSVYRRDVLRPAHRSRLIEYDEPSGRVYLSPKGVAYVEEKLPLVI
jgi:hypothetical protein